MTHFVFISYAIEDKQVAELVANTLESKGIKCWYAPRDIPFGMDYEEAIVEAISNSQLVVFILSAHSNASPHVRREIQNASADDVARQIVPIRIDDVPLHKALRYYLGSSQWLDASTSPIETHLQSLIEQLQPRLPASAASAVETVDHDSQISGRNEPIKSEQDRKPNLTATSQSQPHWSRRGYWRWLLLGLFLLGVGGLIYVWKDYVTKRPASPSSTSTPQPTSPSPVATVDPRNISTTVTVWVRTRNRPVEGVKISLYDQTEGGLLNKLETRVTDKQGKCTFENVFLSRGQTIYMDDPNNEFEILSRLEDYTGEGMLITYVVKRKSIR